MDDQSHIDQFTVGDHVYVLMGCGCRIVGTIKEIRRAANSIVDVETAIGLTHWSSDKIQPIGPLDRLARIDDSVLDQLDVQCRPSDNPWTSCPVRALLKLLKTWSI